MRGKAKTIAAVAAAGETSAERFQTAFGRAVDASPYVIASIAGGVLIGGTYGGFVGAALGGVAGIVCGIKTAPKAK